MTGSALKRREIDTGEPSSPTAAEFAEAMLRALRSQVRSIAPKYFYDAAGVSLYERICESDEYYLTRTEISILREHAPQIAHLIGPRADVVEFGAGSPLKARIVLDALASPARYMPIDLAFTHLEGAAPELALAYPGLTVEPLAADFVRPLALPAHMPGDGRRVGLFLGSTIGNFSVEQAYRFLAGAAELFAGGGLLIGVDLVKDPAVLHRAYNDASGITAAFNRNLLVRANRELGADFDPAEFDHYAFYQPQAQRIEMHLVSARRQMVRLCGREFSFGEGESLQTEISHKYTIEGFRELAQRAGFTPGPVWCDRQRRFSVHWLAAPLQRSDAPGATPPAAAG
jgi:dimethylhistidine N-methyltransferase